MVLPTPCAYVSVLGMDTYQLPKPTEPCLRTACQSLLAEACRWSSLKNISTATGVGYSALRRIQTLDYDVHSVLTDLYYKLTSCRFLYYDGTDLRPELSRKFSMIGKQPLHSKVKFEPVRFNTDATSNIERFSATKRELCEIELQQGKI